MAGGEDRTAKGAMAVSVGSAIAAAVALLRQSPSASNGAVQLPQELWNLLIAIAASTDGADKDLDAVVQALKSLSVNVKGWPSNTDAIQTTRVICNVANQAVQLPDMPIPDGFSLVIAAWPLNANLIYLGDGQSAATNPNRVDALAAGGLRTLAVSNANIIWVSALAAGDSVTLLSEKRKAV